MKRVSVFLVFFLMFFCTFAQKNMRIAYVDMEHILENMPEYKAASEALSQKVKGWEDEAQAQQNDIDYLKKQLEVEKALLTPELVADREEEIALLERNLQDYQQKKFGPDGDYITQRWMLIQPIQDQVFSLAQEVGKSKKFDYIFSKDDATAVFASEKNDITKLLLRLLRKNENAEDRNKEISILLKENLEVDYKDEKTLKREELQRKREAEKLRVEQQKKEREAAREKQLQERNKNKK